MGAASSSFSFLFGCASSFVLIVAVVDGVRGGLGGMWLVG